MRFPVFLFTLTLFLVPGFVFSATTPATVYECTCTYREPTATNPESHVFTNDEWIADDATPTDALCETKCTGYAERGGNTYQSFVYTTRQAERTFTPIKPILGVAIPGFNGFQDPVPVNGVLFINFIGEYIAAIYKWLIGAMSVFSVIMIMVGGIQYMMAGGSSAGVTKAKERTFNALIGMTILLGSYVILQTTNPELTLFRGLEIGIVEGIPTETLSPGPTGSATKLCESVKACQDFCDHPDLVPDKTSGMATLAQVVPLTKTEGLFLEGSISVLPDTKTKLEAAAKIAAERGYSIVVVGGFRSLKGQLDKACVEIRRAAKQGGSPKIPSDVAWPGSSAHGTGTAVDIRLGKPDGQSLWHVNFDNQKEANGGDVKTLAEIMYAAGWQRYHGEIWHFQTETGTCTSNQCFGYPGDANCTCN